MIRMSRMTDYALVILTHLARDPDRVHTARGLADEVSIPLPTVSKVLKTLTRGGLLASHRGAHGGYALARPAEDVTMVDIVQAVDGPVALTLCCETTGACDIEHSCPTSGNLRLINDAVNGVLRNIRLVDIARPLPRERLLTIGGTAAFPRGTSK